MVTVINFADDQFGESRLRYLHNETLNKLVLKYENSFWNDFSGFINVSVNMVLHFLVSASLTGSSNLVPLLI